MATRPGTDGASGSLEVDMVFSTKRGNTRPPGRCSQWVGKRWGRKALTWAGDDCDAPHGPGRASGTEAGGASSVGARACPGARRAKQRRGIPPTAARFGVAATEVTWTMRALHRALVPRPLHGE